MPVGIYVPARQNDLALDTDVGASPSQGSLFYKGPAKWNALAPAPAGNVLVSGGAGADPIWQAPGAGVLTGAVILAPASSTRNVIQPTGDFIPLTLKGSVGQTQPLLQFQDSAGTPLTTFTALGRLGIGKIPSATAQFDLQADATSNESVIVRDINGNRRITVFPIGNIFCSAIPATASAQSNASPTLTWETTRWDGSATQTEGFRLSVTRNSSGVNDNQWVMLDNATQTAFAVAGIGGQVAVGYGFPGPGSKLTQRGQFFIQSLAATTPITVWRAAASQSAEVWQLQNSAGTVTASMTADGRAQYGTTAVPALTMLQVNAVGATFKGVVVKGFASQSANLQEWQDSGAGILASISAAGIITNSVTQTDVSGSPSGANQTSLSTNPAADSSAIFIANNSTVTTANTAVNYTSSVIAEQATAAHAGTGTVTMLMGAQFISRKNSTGIVTTAVAAQFQVQNNNATNAIGTGDTIRIIPPVLTGAITTCRGIRIQNMGGANVTTAQALLIDNQSGATTTNVAIQTGTGLVNFGDSVQIIGSRDANQLLIQGFSTQTNTLITTRTSAGNLLFTVPGDGVGHRHQLVTAATNSAQILHIFGAISSGTPANGFGIQQQWRLQTSTTQDQTAGRVQCVWADATHATRKGRIIFEPFDAASQREALRMEASGTAAMIGFLGANASAQQATASTAGIAAIRTDTLANAVTDIRVILTALRAWGVTYGLTANTA